jgi:hypothetical protein
MYRYLELFVAETHAVIKKLGLPYASASFQASVKIFKAIEVQDIPLYAFHSVTK